VIKLIYLFESGILYFVRSRQEQRVLIQTLTGQEWQSIDTKLAFT